MTYTPEMIKQINDLLADMERECPAKSEILHLAIELADCVAARALSENCRSVYVAGGNWHDLDTAPAAAELTMEVEYLSLRGLLVRYPDDPRLVRVVWPLTENTHES